MIFDRITEEMGNVKRDWKESMKHRKMNVKEYIDNIKTNPELYGKLTDHQLSLLEECLKYKEVTKPYLGFVGVSLRHKEATGHGQEEVDHEFKKLEKILLTFQ